MWKVKIIIYKNLKIFFSGCSNERHTMYTICLKTNKDSFHGAS